MQKTYNINSVSGDPIENGLSNFSLKYPFEIKGLKFSSVEIALQMIKFPEESEERESIIRLFGENASKIAKEIGAKALCDFVYWNGERIVYNSKQNREILRMFIREKFFQNKEAMELLLKTKGHILIHEVGLENLNTSLPKDVFLRFLEEIRDEN